MSFLVVLVGKIGGDSWFTWWFNHPGPSIAPTRTPMRAPLFSAFFCDGQLDGQAHLHTTVYGILIMAANGSDRELLDSGGLSERSGRFGYRHISVAMAQGPGPSKRKK